MNLVADCFDGETVRSDVGGNFRIKRQIRYKSFGQRTLRQIGNFLADDFAVQIQRFDIDSEVSQCGDRKVIAFGDAGDDALLDMLAGNKNRHGIGGAAVHAVALGVTAVVAGD